MNIEEIRKIEEDVFNGLKDFQKATVKRICDIFKNQSRVLVADEVGLGKTLIARGVIAELVLKHCEKIKDKPFKVVYVCSNFTIAKQNLPKLDIYNACKDNSISYTRLSMQSLEIYNKRKKQENMGVEFIAITPETSINMKSRIGWSVERALIYAVISKVFISKEEEREKLKKLLQGNVKDENWDNLCEYYCKILDEDYCKNLKKEIYVKTVSQIKDVLNSNENEEKKITEQQLVLINNLRNVFAQISIDMLSPDLIIMDEFQRYKNIINEPAESEIGKITKKFFSTDKKILLLSATPYKMYSTLDEIQEGKEECHYTEFEFIMKFLNKNLNKDLNKDLNKLLEDYSIALKDFSNTNNDEIKKLKETIENQIYENVCRTERISDKQIANADIIDDSSVKEPLKIDPADIKSYIHMQKLLDETVNGRLYVDYVKSAPYLMSFMNNYKIKTKIEEYFKQSNQVDICIANKDFLWIDRNKINNYKKIKLNNARLEDIKKRTLEEDMQNLLWIPPSKPYYEPQGVFKGKKNLSKTLIFSCWEMVPRMLSSIISYEVERRTVGRIARKYKGEEAHYFCSDKEKRYPPPRLNFKVDNGKANSMKLFCLLYPSKFLTNIYDPIKYMKENKNDVNKIKEDIKTEIKESIKRKYPNIQWNEEINKNWYYLAPFLLDDSEYADKWNELCIIKYKNNKDNSEEKEQDEKNSVITHLETLKRQVDEIHKVEISDNLLDLLADIAIASPAICINRTYKKYIKDEVEAAVKSSELAKIFINRMNTPEATAIVELAYKDDNENKDNTQNKDDIHWHNLLKYCRDGNFQAMFDEYVHLINDGFCSDLHQKIIESLQIRAASYKADTFESFKQRIKEKDKKDEENNQTIEDNNGNTNNSEEQEDDGKSANIRTHFAVAFLKGVASKESDIERKNKVRNAFNSPFWPFVLVTTSIGQEGLDFHSYCRRIVHWNLPSNPIDIEQREGRINRYKCLAIRQELARRYDNDNLTFEQDVWKEMFKRAKDEKKNNSSDLIPNWGLPSEDKEKTVKIERIVPMYPFSEDEIKYKNLIKILSLYRLTLGQPRQEEVLNHLFNNIEENKLKDLEELFINLSPFYRELAAEDINKNHVTM